MYSFGYFPGIWLDAGEIPKRIHTFIKFCLVSLPEPVCNLRMTSQHPQMQLICTWISETSSIHHLWRISDSSLSLWSIQNSVAFQHPYFSLFLVGVVFVCSQTLFNDYHCDVQWYHGCFKFCNDWLLQDMRSYILCMQYLFLHTFFRVLLT